MRKGLCLLVILGAAALCVLKAQAVTTSGPIAVTAKIQGGTPDMTVVIHKVPNGDWKLINWDEKLSSMAFDKFTIVQKTGKSSQWTNIDSFAVFVYADGLGAGYQIKSSGSGSFVSGSNTLPAGSFACIPVYSADDSWKYPDGTVVKQGAMPSGASLGVKAKALQSNQVVYTSEKPGSPRIIEAYYAFPPYSMSGSTATDPYSGYQPIPASQANGTYTGVTVTLNIAAI